MCTSLPRLRSAQFERSSAIGRLLCRGPARGQPGRDSILRSKRADAPTALHRGSAENATALPKYFGLGRGLTFYTWTSDQYSQYGSKVISSTVRDATYVLDEILEHTTDTAGYTEIVFALFHLLGLQFAPRIRDLGAQRLYRLDAPPQKEGVAVLLKGLLRSKTLLDNWDELLRVAGSLKLGWVTASLLISKLQTGARENVLSRALRDLGRHSSAYRLRELAGLDPEAKGESRGKEPP